MPYCHAYFHSVHIHLLVLINEIFMPLNATLSIGLKLWKQQNTKGCYRRGLSLVQQKKAWVFNCCSEVTDWHLRLRFRLWITIVSCKSPKETSHGGKSNIYQEATIWKSSASSATWEATEHFDKLDSLGSVATSYSLRARGIKERPNPAAVSTHPAVTAGHFQVFGLPGFPYFWSRNCCHSMLPVCGSMQSLSVWVVEFFQYMPPLPPRSPGGTVWESTHHSASAFCFLHCRMQGFSHHRSNR